MLAGDWNAVQQASDRRPSAHLNPLDNIFMTDLAAMGLQSVVALPDGCSSKTALECNWTDWTGLDRRRAASGWPGSRRPAAGLASKQPRPQPH